MPKPKTKAPSIEDMNEPHPNNLRVMPLKNAYPEKAVECYYKKNCGFGPEDFSYGLKVIAWWRCSIGHVYHMRVLHSTLKTVDSDPLLGLYLKHPSQTENYYQMGDEYGI